MALAFVLIALVLIVLGAVLGWLASWIASARYFRRLEVH